VRGKNRELDEREGEAVRGGETAGKKETRVGALRGWKKAGTGKEERKKDTEQRAGKRSAQSTAR